MSFAILKGANLREANLLKADLLGANLQGADLLRANLQDTNLWGANLLKAGLRRANLQKANLELANLQEGYLGLANLQEAGLRRANLQDTNLWGANLLKADLLGANLQEANLGLANLHKANLGEANLQEANLGQANLQEANLGQANLHQANLWRANFQEAYFGWANLQDADLRGANFRGTKNVTVTVDPEYDHIVSGSYALAIHSLFVNKPSPELFISDPTDIRTSRLAGFLVQSLFDYKVPQLQVLNAEQILAVRDYLKETKEGFTYYIYEQAAEVERRIKEWNQSEIVAAQQTFEQKLLPQYEEFRRQLAAKKTGFWSKVAVAGGKFLQVNAAPWTLAFWGAVLEMCGVSLDEAAKADAADLSNKSQAFHYLARLESKVSKTS
jgi:uncharacterized protein YjbI with pentapeptide repeats